MENSSGINGVFSLQITGSHKGLIWTGPLEECDLCHEFYPMSWIIFSGKQFLCYACHYPNWKLDKESVEIHKRLNM